MPILTKAETNPKIRSARPSSANVALDTALAASQRVESARPAPRPQKTHFSRRNYIAAIGEPKAHPSKKAETLPGPPRPKRRAAISADLDTAEERYVNRRQLRTLVPASDMSLYRWQSDPEIAFPLPVKLGSNGWNYWWLPAVRDWLRRRAKQKNEPRVVRRRTVAAE
ncbi:MAG TPA: hypothetical protein VGH13_04200 [Xanthobacteraceae bacterium]|jgi:predicted DNA-binding transcriptional regulator AlpA